MTGLLYEATSVNIRALRMAADIPESWVLLRWLEHIAFARVTALAQTRVTFRDIQNNEVPATLIARDSHGTRLVLPKFMAPVLDKSPEGRCTTLVTVETLRDTVQSGLYLTFTDTDKHSHFLQVVGTLHGGNQLELEDVRGTRYTGYLVSAHTNGAVYKI